MMMSVYVQVVPLSWKLRISTALNTQFQIFFLLLALYDVIGRGYPYMGI